MLKNAKDYRFSDRASEMKWVKKKIRRRVDNIYYGVKEVATNHYEITSTRTKKLKIYSKNVYYFCEKKKKINKRLNI